MSVLLLDVTPQKGSFSTICAMCTFYQSSDGSNWLAVLLVVVFVVVVVMVVVGCWLVVFHCWLLVSVVVAAAVAITFVALLL